jgi:hypothetical protein
MQYLYYNLGMLLWPILLSYILNKFWYQLSEDGEIVVPKHVVVL